MKTQIIMPGGLFEDLLTHLLPRGSTLEEAAFLFALPRRTRNRISFDVVETAKLSPNEFASQLDDYLELLDETRARLIKRAHDLQACLIEMHSHRGPFSAAFSYADRTGLRETVPQIWWRLKKRPYIAVVVAERGFDALVWLENPRVPQKLDGVIAGDRLLLPTTESLEGWA